MHIYIHISVPSLFLKPNWLHVVSRNSDIRFRITFSTTLEIILARAIGQTCQPSRFWRDSPAFFYQMSRVPLNHGNVPLFVRSRIFFARAICNAAAVPDVRFLAKIPNGTAAESPCYSVFWNAIDFCRLYTTKKISMWALPTVPLFAGKSRFFTRNVPLKHSPGWQV